MISLATTPTVDFILAVLISLSFPLCLYCNGFWTTQVKRNDVRVIIRNMISVTTITVLGTITLFCAIDVKNISQRFAVLMRYIGFNWVSSLLDTVSFHRYGSITSETPNLLGVLGQELWIVFLGAILVNILFLGPLLQNILEFTLRRNKMRVYAIQIQQYQQLRRNQAIQQAQTNALEQQNNLNQSSNRGVELPINRHLPQPQTNQTNQPASTPQSSSSPVPAISWEFPRYQHDSLISVILFELVHFGDILGGSTIQSQTPFESLHKTISSYIADVKRSFSLYVESRSFKSPQEIQSTIELDSMVDVRTLLFVPIVEEWVYRSLLYPFFLHGILLSWPESKHPLLWTILFSAGLFASSHLHHFFNHYKERKSISTALLIVTVQWIYCFIYALFGGYIFSLPSLLASSSQATTWPDALQSISSPLFSLPAAIVSHSICNAYGLPDLSNLQDEQSPLRPFRQFLFLAYFLGLGSFIILLIWLPTWLGG